MWIGLPSPDQKMVKKKVTTEWRKEVKAAAHGNGRCVEVKFKLSFLVFHGWQKLITSSWYQPTDIAEWAARNACWTLKGSQISHKSLAQTLWFKRVESLLITGEYE